MYTVVSKHADVHLIVNGCALGVNRKLDVFIAVDVDIRENILAAVSSKKPLRCCS
jgi:hypothetical protein